MLLGVLLFQLFSLGSIDTVGPPGEPYDDGDNGGLEEEHHSVGGRSGGSREVGEGGGGQQQRWAQQDGLNLSLDHVKFIQDGQKRATVEPLVAVPPDVKASWRKAFGELANVEDG